MTPAELVAEVTDYLDRYQDPANGLWGHACYPSAILDVVFREVYTLRGIDVDATTWDTPLTVSGWFALVDGRTIQIDDDGTYVVADVRPPVEVLETVHPTTRVGCDCERQAHHEGWD